MAYDIHQFLIYILVTTKRLRIAAFPITRILQIIDIPGHWLVDFSFSLKIDELWHVRGHLVMMKDEIELMTSVVVKVLVVAVDGWFSVDLIIVSETGEHDSLDQDTWIIRFSVPKLLNDQLLTKTGPVCEISLPYIDSSDIIFPQKVLQSIRKVQPRRTEHILI